MNRESRLPATPESARAARGLVREAAARAGLDGHSTWALLLATSEAMANAVEHGRCDFIRLSIEQTEDGLSVEVGHRGSFAHRPAAVESLSVRGRGIPIMAAVVDRLELHPSDRWTRVRFTKRLRAA